MQHLATRSIIDRGLPDRRRTPRTPLFSGRGGRWCHPRARFVLRFDGGTDVADRCARRVELLGRRSHVDTYGARHPMRVPLPHRTIGVTRRHEAVCVPAVPGCLTSAKARHVLQHLGMACREVVGGVDHLGRARHAIGDHRERWKLRVSRWLWRCGPCRDRCWWALHDLRGRIGRRRIGVGRSRWIEYERGRDHQGRQPADQHPRWIGTSRSRCGGRTCLSPCLF